MKADGAAAEALAARFLEARGLKLLARNYRCRFGEIDLILKEGPTVVFAEVRLRSSARFGGALASVTPAKQRKLSSAARHYLAGLGSAPPCRFDVVVLDGLCAERIQWIRDAFGE